MLFSKKQYPIFEIGTIVSFERELRTIYGRVVGLKEYEKIFAQLSKRQVNDYFNGRYVMMVDSDGGLYSHFANDLHKIEDPNQVIKSLRQRRQHERERGVPVDSQIHFLEQMVRTHPKN